MKLRSTLVFLTLLGAVACGGGSNNINNGGGGGGGGTPPPPNNVLPVNVTLGVNGNYADGLFATVTVCVPGTTTCQSIDNVLVDTGSYGLRLLASQVTVALPTSSDSGGNPLAECIQYSSSYNWGPVATADVQLAGEKANAVPIQLLGPTGFAAAPSDCTGSGLSENDTQATLGANGILGIGVFRHDCGAGCTAPQSTIPPVYFSCPSAGCTPTLVDLGSQVQNPIWLFPQDNNGVLITLPAVRDGGAPTATGSLTFGVGTQSNNGLGNATVLATDVNGNITTEFQNASYGGTIFDTGSNGNFFLDATTLGLPLCADGNSGFYCPTAPVGYTATNQSAGSVAASAPATWNVANAQDLFNTGYAAFNNLGGPNSGAFDFGLPFFFGRTIFFGINGTTTGTIPGPYMAY